MRQIPRPVVVITSLDCQAPILPESMQHVSASDPALRPYFPPHWTQRDILDSCAVTQPHMAAWRADYMRRVKSGEIDEAGGNRPFQRGGPRPPLYPKPIPRAMTVSSFTSVSLVPRQRVLFNIALPSRTYHAIFSSGRFNAHILTPDEYGARLADMFTQQFGVGPQGPNEDTEDSGPYHTSAGVLTDLRGYGITLHGKPSWDKQWDQFVYYVHNRTAGPTDPASSRFINPHLDPADGDNGARFGRPKRPPRRFTVPLLRGQGVAQVLKCDLYAPSYLHNQPQPPAGSDHSAEDGHGQHRPDDDNFVLVLGEVTEIVPGPRSGGVAPEERALMNGVTLSYADGSYRKVGDRVLTFSQKLAQKKAQRDGRKKKPESDDKQREREGKARRGLEQPREVTPIGAVTRSTSSKDPSTTSGKPLPPWARPGSSTSSEPPPWLSSTSSEK